MSIQEIKDLIRTSEGKIFSVRFVKKDGTERLMVARLGVTSYLKGGTKAYDPADYDLITVFDMQKQAYRSINLQTILDIKVNNEHITLN
jgi:hypothetical protein